MKRLLTTGLAMLFLAGCVNVNLPMGRSAELEEVLLEDSEGWMAFDKVAIIDVSGLIAEDVGGGLFGGELTCSPAYLRAALALAGDDPRVKAVVLRIDSPGGTVGASELMAREVAQFRDRTGLPVVAQITGLGCSGAYYLASACDGIHVQPSGIVGSIGVIAVFPQYRKLADKVGLEENVIKSGPLKDIGSGMRAMTDEERGVLQAMIDSNYNTFLDWVAECRPEIGDRATLRKIADGRVYTAQQAQDLKLVDHVCFLDETLDAAKEAAGLADAKIVTYSYNANADANIYSPVARAHPFPLNVNLPAPLRARSPGFYYLWQPGE